MLLLFVIIIIIRVPTSSDTTVLFSQKKLEKHARLHSNQHRGSAAAASRMPATIWTHFQCDSKINPFMSVAFGCYCPGAWCSNNGQCCSQMCFKKTCY